jgi:hypothetical protein
MKAIKISTEFKFLFIHVFSTENASIFLLYIHDIFGLDCMLVVQISVRFDKVYIDMVDDHASVMEYAMNSFCSFSYSCLCTHQLQNLMANNIRILLIIIMYNQF